MNYTDDQKYADVFLLVAPFFKLYFEYCNNFTLAVDVRETLLKKNQKFAKFIKSVEMPEYVQFEFSSDKKKAKKKKKNTFTRKINLENLMIEPVQRLPRYELLLRGILKETAPSHPDFEDLTKAYAMCREINKNYIDKKITQYNQ